MSGRPQPEELSPPIYNPRSKLISGQRKWEKGQVQGWLIGRRREWKARHARPRGERKGMEPSPLVNRRLYCLALIWTNSTLMKDAVHIRDSSIGLCAGLAGCLLAFLCWPGGLYGQTSSEPGKAGGPLNWTSQQDHKNMMDQLGIKIGRAHV